jgi:N-acetyl-gamma-glutamyl-phosphate reductase
MKQSKIENINVAIIGATGYTGIELIRILNNHPDVNIVALTSETNAGKPFSDIYPQYFGLVDKEIQKIEDINKYNVDLVFLALPHGVSMRFVRDYGYKKYKIIDLSADFRLNSASIYKKWYNINHLTPGILSKFVYGLPELFRDQIRRSNLVSNPGCYPTSAILALAPLFKHNIISSNDIIVDSKSGVTGAGAKATDRTHFPEVFGNFSAYSLLNHHHIPEMQKALKDYAKKELNLLFTPHLLPIDRGILTTIYSKSNQSVSEEFLQELYSTFYFNEQFVRIIGKPPSIKSVRGSNYCDIFVTYDKGTNRIITVSVIDNLVKGAAGQAIQNMNIMFNFLENSGLNYVPLSP